MTNKVLSNVLKELGVQQHLKGWDCIMEAVNLILEDNTYKNAITKRLYPAVADRFNTTASKVERAIRHAIENAFLFGSFEAIEKVFGNTVSSQKGKPTNAHFICALSEYVRTEIASVDVV